MRFWQGAGLDGFEATHTPDFIDHCAADRPADRNGFRAGIERLYGAFPDFFATAEAMVIDEAHASVAIRWSAVGHMRGSFLGQSPAGQRVIFRGIEIIVVRGTRVAERWGEWDEALIQKQIAPA